MKNNVNDKKMDISLSRTYTINTGNYSSIKPSVTITKTSIDRKDFQEEYEELTELIDSVIALETLKISDEMSTINNIGYKDYTDIIRKDEDDIGMFIKKFSEKD